MKTYVMDTFCWTELLQGGPKSPAVQRILDEKDAEFLISTLTLAELSAKLHAAGKGHDVHHVLAAVCSRAKTVDISLGIAHKAGQLWAERHPKDNTGLIDCIIAAIALAHDATIVSGGQHFKNFPNAIIV
ncbi:PIN domain-containing protein [Candidatus Micrarchaeota archaeon]|nr:PIN domain-containing protein [Candidatus Micrarchaeota archaeon]